MGDAALAVAAVVPSLFDDPTLDRLPIAPWPVLLVVGTSAASLLLRRRFPVAVWAATTVLAVVVVLLGHTPIQASAPVVVALYSVGAVRGRVTTVVAALLTGALGLSTLALDRDDPLGDRAVVALLGWLFTAAAVGIAVQARRAVLAAAVERAAEAERTRDEEARRRVAEERMRVARELHDVVAHHIAVINVQAGLARHVVDARPEDAKEALGHVRDSAAAVLAELSTILGLLRAPVDGASDAADPTEPVPGLARVDDLLASAGRSGLTVESTVTVDPATVPSGISVTAYRVLQEALTNARKHGTGHARACIEHADGRLRVEVRNEVTGTAAPVAGGTANGTGHGVMGMRERVGALGGTLRAEREGDHFVLQADLPWEHTT